MLVTIEKVVENWWNGLDFEQKYEIYASSDNEVELTDEEKDAIEGDIEMHRKFVEGEEIE